MKNELYIVLKRFKKKKSKATPCIGHYGSHSVLGCVYICVIFEKKHLYLCTLLDLQYVFFLINIYLIY